jgi:hypothetical protein
MTGCFGDVKGLFSGGGNLTLQRFFYVIWAHFQRFALETGLFGAPAPAHSAGAAQTLRVAPLQSLARLGVCYASAQTASLDREENTRHNKDIQSKREADLSAGPLLEMMRFSRQEWV